MPSWLQAELAEQSVKCAPEPRTEEMPSRTGRVKADPVICRRVISESGTACNYASHALGHGRLFVCAVTVRAGRGVRPANFPSGFMKSP